MVVKKSSSQVTHGLNYWFIS